MIRRFIALGLYLIAFLPIGSVVFAQTDKRGDITVVSEEDSTPSIIKALPDYEQLGGKAIRIRNTADLKKAVGDNAVTSFVGFKDGEDAAAADYEAGKLLIVEYLTAETAAEADNQIKSKLSNIPNTYYRKTGNYAVLVFNGKDEVSANALMEKVKYEKTVRWLGEDPFLEEKYQRENNEYITATRDMFIGSFVAVVTGITSTVIMGLIVGYLYFKRRDRKHAEMQAYSDAGGMTRLNLDGLSENNY